MAKNARPKPKSGTTPAAPASERSATAADLPESLPLRISWWALVASVVLVPLTLGYLIHLGANGAVFNDAFLLPKLLVLRVCTLVSLGAWALHMLTKGGKVRLSPILWPVIAFLAWAAVSTATSVSVETSLFGKYTRDEGLLTYVNYAVLFFLTLQFTGSAVRVRTLAGALAAASVPVALYGLLQYVGADPVPWRMDFGAERAFSTFGNPDILGGYLAFTIPVAMVLALTEDRTRKRVVLWVTALLNAAVLLVSFTRGAWIGGAVAVALVAFSAWRGAVRVRRADVATWAASAAALAAVLGLQHLWNRNDVFSFTEFAAQRLTGAEVYGVGSRLMIWQQALDMITARPLLGWGLDTFRFISPRFQTAEYVRQVGNTIADNAHNYPLQMAAGVGVVGLLILLGVFGWTAVRSATSVFGRSESADVPLRGAFWAGCAGYLVNLLFGLSVPGVTFILWIAMAVVLAAGATERTVRAPRWGLPAAVALAVLLLAGAVAQVPVARADHAFMTSNQPSAGEQRVSAARAAVRLNPLNHAYREGLALTLSNAAIDVAGAADAAVQRGSAEAPAMLQSAARALSTAEDALKDAIAFVPDDYPCYQYLASLLNLRGDLTGDGSNERAVRMAAEGLTRAPNVMALHFEYAYGLDRSGRREEAIAALRQALTIDPGHARTALLLADILEQEGQLTEALSVLRNANAVRPAQADIEAAIGSLGESATATP